MIRLNDEHGQTVVSLSSVALITHGRTGKGVHLSVQEGAIILSDTSGPRMTLNELGLILNDVRGNVRVGLDSLAGLVLSDGRGNALIGLGGGPHGPRLVMFDEQGKGSAGLYAGDKESRPSLELSDGQGYKAVLGGTSLANSATGETTQRSAASLVFFWPDKKVIWSAP